MSLLRVERRGGVTWIVLANPARRNALDGALAAALAAAIREADADPATGALVVTGSDGSFCAGADRDALWAAANAAPQDREALLDGLYAPFLALRDARKPTVAAVGGPAVGAGLNLVLAADLAVAGTSARFLAGFARIGLHPGGAHTAMLRERVGAQTAAALLLFGESLDGPSAAARGLVYECVPDDQVAPRAQALAAAAAGAPGPVLATTKATLRAAAALAFDEVLRIERTAQAASLGTDESRARLQPRPGPGR
jgi:enoyl-CoA hydratase